jgi:hypothetical protein
LERRPGVRGLFAGEDDEGQPDRQPKRSAPLEASPFEGLDHAHHNRNRFCIHWFTS